MSERGNASVPVACQPAYQAAATGSFVPEVVAREVTRWRIDSTVRERIAKDITDFSDSAEPSTVGPSCHQQVPLLILSFYQGFGTLFASWPEAICRSCRIGHVPPAILSYTVELERRTIS